MSGCVVCDVQKHLNIAVSVLQWNIVDCRILKHLGNILHGGTKK